MQDFLSDVATLRERARAHIEQGSVTESYGADRERVISVLNDVLATELVCVLRYKRHYYTASGPSSTAIAQEFLQHAGEEQGHADMVAARIVQLGGAPDFDPAGLATRSHAEYKVGEGLLDMVREDLIAERIAIASYTEILRWLGDKDPTTSQLIRGILSVEEEHAEDMLSILQDAGQEIRVD